MMAIDVWLPRSHELADRSKIRSLLYSGDAWQIFDTDGPSNTLLVLPELAQRWIEDRILENSLFGELTFGALKYRSLNCGKRYAMAPVEHANSPASKVDAIAFSLALKESRKLSPDASFHDAVYVEQYSRLLPVWTLSSRVDDATVLGTWLTGGVVISTDSFRRLNSLTGWMPAGDLAEIVAAAGLPMPPDSGVLTKPRPASHVETTERSAGTAVSIRGEETEPPIRRTGPDIFRLPGRPQLEAFFNEHIVDIIFNVKKYRALGIEFPSAIVLHGPPGCGKTFAVERLVEFIDWPSYSIDSNSVGSPYIHETSRKIAEVFDKAIEGAPSVIVIDEMESFLAHRQSAGTSGLHHVEEVAEFLRRIPEATKNRVLIVAMTNTIDMIDPAILRRGRFDHVIEVGMPSRIEVTSLLTALLSKLPTSDTLDLDSALDMLTGKALSDAAFVLREASRLAAKAGKSQLDQESLNAALETLPKDRDKKGRRIGFVRDARTE
jgi:cell division protease FtsH